MFPELVEACCVTLVWNPPPSKILHYLQGSGGPPCTKAEQVAEAVCALLDADAVRRLVALAVLDGWTLLIEPDNYLALPRSKPLQRPPARLGLALRQHRAAAPSAQSTRWHLEHAPAI